jgi:hypothetical protein
VRGCEDLRGAMKRRRESSTGWERLRAGAEVKVKLRAKVCEVRVYRRVIPTYMSDLTRYMI